jgi:hypothetical protein
MVPFGHRLEVAVLDSVLVGNGAVGVRLQNLTLEKAFSAVVDAKTGGNGVSWQLQDCTVRFAHNDGVSGGKGTESARFTYLRTLITNNGQNGIVSGGSWQQILSSEVSWNNIANYRAVIDGVCKGYWSAGALKFVLAEGTPSDPGLIIDGLESHHNVGSGYWDDVHTRYVRVQGGHFHHNEGPGLVHEISCDLDVRMGEFDHNGIPLKNTDTPLPGAGILVSDSNNVNIFDNVVHDNARGIILEWVPHTGMDYACLGGDGGTADISGALQNVVVQANTVTMCSGISGQLGNDTIANRNNRFLGNIYIVPNAAGRSWVDHVTEPWTAWQGTSKQDPAPFGAMVTGCPP